MPKIKAFRLVVHEKIFKDLSKFPLFNPLNDPLKGPVPCFESPFPRDTSYQI